MRIIQIISSITFGDGVSNDCLAMRDMLRRNGHTTAVYAENIDPRLKKRQIVPIEQLSEPEPEDIAIYHLSTGTELNYKIGELKCKKVVRYHNITPPEFFLNCDAKIYNNCRDGVEGAAHLAGRIHHVMADSEYNKSDLVQMGYDPQGVEVFPILIAFDDYSQGPDRELMKRFEDGRTNLVFVGRLAPNKKQEDVIKTFYFYKKYYDPEARLFLVGNQTGKLYMEQLKQYVRRLCLQDVYFTGQVRFDQILAYYRLADAFLCMSEHEGFCIPLVEAMYFDVPIIAYDSSAVGETLGGAGVLLKEKDCLLAAGMLDRIMGEPALKDELIRGQRERLDDFSNEKIEKDMMRYLDRVIREKAK